MSEQYSSHRQGSRALYERARQSIAGGISHDVRYLEPFPIYIDRARGAHKWDVDGNRYVDYVMGHGALLLGHAHPRVVRAVQEQVERGTHYGASHELEIRWAELVKKLVPCAELVRFFASGTEATLMAMRLVRAVTGKKKIVKFEQHFHGWHDHAFQNSPGVVPGIPENIAVVPPNDLEALQKELSGGDVAGVFCEPLGASTGTVPFVPGFLRQVREVTQEMGVPLVMDEVVTGFRLAPGGAQEYFGVVPEISTHAKIVAGGLPGGAIAGKAQFLERLINKDAAWNKAMKVPHPGTYNGNPLSAAAAVAVLEYVATGEPTRLAAERAGRLVQGINAAFREVGLGGCAYGEASVFHLVVDPELPPGGPFPYTAEASARLMANRGNQGWVMDLKRHLLTHGVDMLRLTGWVSCVHSDADIDFTVEAMKKSLRALKG